MLTQVCLLSFALHACDNASQLRVYILHQLDVYESHWSHEHWKVRRRTFSIPPAPSFQILLCDCENSSHHAIALSMRDLHVRTNPTFATSVTVVNHIDHCAHAIAIIAPRRRSLHSL
jgi:hypothetical protein